MSYSPSWGARDPPQSLSEEWKAIHTKVWGYKANNKNQCIYLYFATRQSRFCFHWFSSHFLPAAVKWHETFPEYIEELLCLLIAGSTVHFLPLNQSLLLTSPSPLIANAYLLALKRSALSLFEHTNLVTQSNASVLMENRSGILTRVKGKIADSTESLAAPLPQMLWNSQTEMEPAKTATSTLYEHCHCTSGTLTWQLWCRHRVRVNYSVVLCRACLSCQHEYKQTATSDSFLKLQALCMCPLLPVCFLLLLSFDTGSSLLDNQHHRNLSLCPVCYCHYTDFGSGSVSPGASSWIMIYLCLKHAYICAFLHQDL